MIQVSDFFRNVRTMVLPVAILIGVLIGAVSWFLSLDPESPRVEVSHDIYSVCLDLDSRHRFVRTIIDVRNVGPVRFKLSKNDLYVHQVVPFENPPGEALFDGGETESKSGPFDWRKLLYIDNTRDLRSTVLNPNENQRQYVDFVIPPSSTVIELKSEVDVERVSNFIEKTRLGIIEKVGLRKNDGISSGRAKTIYDVRASICTQQKPDREAAETDSEASGA